MKLKFKKQAYQTRAVESVVDCFKGLHTCLKDQALRTVTLP
jgi:restriction endonuclease